MTESSSAGTASTAAPPAAAPREQVRILGLAVLVGVCAAVAASVFLWLMARGQELIWDRLPRQFGLVGSDGRLAWWWIALVLVVAAGVVALARRMPGATGNGPLSGFHFNDAPAIMPSVLIASFATLLFGIALGPEAPLIVLGSGVGALFAWRAARPDPSASPIAMAMMMVGGLAAISAVFGNPFITAFMLLEFSAFGLVPARLIVPGFVALASSYLVQVGLWGLPGFGVHPLSVPGVPVYSTVKFGDLVTGVVVALIAAALSILIQKAGSAIDRLQRHRPLPVLVGAALITAAVAIIAVEFLGLPLDSVLFSGQTGMPSLIAETSLVAVIAILLFKAVAYAVALGGGFRGGPIFPATFLGVAVGVAVHLIVPNVSVTPLAAVGIAASAGAMIRLPGTSGLLAMLLVSTGSVAVAPFAILGAVIGVVIRVFMDGRSSHVAAAGSSSAAAAPSSGRNAP